MEETVWTGEVSISVSNPDNWTNGTPNSYDKEGVIPKNRYDYYYEPDWDISDFTILIRIEGRPIITINSSCYLSGECYAPDSVITYVDLLTLDRPPPMPGDGVGVLEATDFPKYRETATYILAASNASTQEKGRADKVCPGSADDVVINDYLGLCPTGYGKVVLSGGTFDISDTISIPYGIELHGTGNGGTNQTKLDWTKGAEDDVIIVNSAEVAHDTARGGGLFNFYLDGNNGTGAGFRIRYTWGYVISNVTMRYMKNDAIVIESSYDMHIDDCDIRDSASCTGISIRPYGGNQTTFVKITGSNMSSCGDYGVEILSGGTIVMDTCWFESGPPTPTSNIYINYDNAYVHLVNSNFSSGATGTTVTSVECIDGYLFMDSNRIRGDSAAGAKKLVTFTGNELICYGNLFAGWGSSGAGGGPAINVGGGDLVSITGNNFVGTSYAGYAIEVSSGYDVTITGNTFRYGSGVDISALINGSVIINGNWIYQVNGIEDYVIETNSNNCMISNNVILNTQKAGIKVTGAGAETITGNHLQDIGQAATDTYYGIYLLSSSNVVTNNKLKNSGAPFMNYGIYCNGVDDNIINDNHIRGAATADIYFTGTCDRNTLVGNRIWDNTVTLPSNVSDWIIKDNLGWIAPGEIRTKSGALSSGNVNDIFMAWANPEAQDILIRKVVIEITTAGGTVGCELDVGIADDAAGTNRGTEFFDDIDGNAVAIRDSFLAGDGGTQTKWVLCEDSASGTDAFVVGQILTQNAASLVGKYYIEYCGR